jgi:hypothetical protein
VMVRGSGGETEQLGEVRLYPTRMRFVTGVARAYDDDFPTELSHLVRCPVLPAVEKERVYDFCQPSR